jgi:hypothetical protein
MSDSYIGIIQDQWESILELYKQFEDKKPVMLFDIQEETVYAYPYEGFKAELSKKSRTSLEQQYERAVENNYVVVFVRDNDQANLVSYSFELEE